MRRPSSVISGIRRAVSGSKEVAKCVAVRSREHVAWSIEAAFPLAGTELVRHCHFTGEAPHHSSDPLAEAADSGRVTGENPGKKDTVARKPGDEITPLSLCAELWSHRPGPGLGSPAADPAPA